jgi:hypothetical protein
MISVRRIKLRCPFCRAVYEKSISLVRLGPGIQTCAKCDQSFSDGSVEWPLATTAQRREYLFPRQGIAFFAGNIIVGSALVLLTRPRLQEGFLLIAFAVALTAIPTVVYYLRCAIRIRRSVERHNAALLRNAGYHSGAISEAWHR